MNSLEDRLRWVTSVIPLVNKDAHKELYTILIGERNELLRLLKNKEDLESIGRSIV